VIRSLLLAGVLALTSVAAFAQASAPATPAPGAAITTNDIKNVDTPSAAARIKGDPDGGQTGNVSDIAVADSKKGLAMADVVNQIGQNKILLEGPRGASLGPQPLR